MDRKKADMFFLVDRVKKHITTDPNGSRFHVCRFQSFTLGGLVPPKSDEEQAIGIPEKNVAHEEDEMRKK